MHFYVLAKHIANGNPKLTVGVTIKPQDGLGKTQIEELLAVLREMGLGI